MGDRFFIQHQKITHKLDTECAPLFIGFLAPRVQPFEREEWRHVARVGRGHNRSARRADICQRCRPRGKLNPLLEKAIGGLGYSRAVEQALPFYMHRCLILRWSHANFSPSGNIAEFILHNLVST